MYTGLSMTRQITFLVIALITHCVGGQIVHNYYKPLDDLEELVQEELKKRNADQKNKIM